MSDGASRSCVQIDAELPARKRSVYSAVKALSDQKLLCRTEFRDPSGRQQWRIADGVRSATIAPRPAAATTRVGATPTESSPRGSAETSAAPIGQWSNQ
ncbi:MULTISPECIES: hypothetical protein [Nocardia]|nr:hypothetical protein [Nocardia africana]MCC3317902.1 hypothetical protein [Nocardia africana]